MDMEHIWARRGELLPNLHDFFRSITLNAASALRTSGMAGYARQALSSRRRGTHARNLKQHRPHSRTDNRGGITGP
jgi:hypothetical protein